MTLSLGGPLEADLLAALADVADPLPALGPPREPPGRPEPRPEQGWCCLDGEVYQSPQDACEDEDGSFFARQRAAMAACLITGCCLDGEFKLGESLRRCEELGGTFMAATEVPRRCR